jgi:hypothetical protein
MPLPSSGPLSFSAIRAEVVPGGTNSNVSLRTLSSTAGFSTPDAVSEFYGYSALTYSYYGTWALNDPCDYTYYDIYSGSDGKYYVDFGTYTLMYDFAPGSYWYEYLYYEPMFDPFGNIYNEWTINSTSTVLTNNGLTNSSC